MLRITRANIFNWLRLILDIYPLTKEERFAIKRYMNRNDKVHRDKELEDILLDIEYLDNEKERYDGRYCDV